MEINEVIPFLKEHAHVGWYGEKTPESSFESLEALPPDVLTQVCYLANGVYQPILDLESWLDTPWVIEGIEIYCANKGPNVYVPVTRERLNEVRNGLTNIRHHYGFRPMRDIRAESRRKWCKGHKPLIGPPTV